MNNWQSAFCIAMGCVAVFLGATAGYYTGTRNTDAALIFGIISFLCLLTSVVAAVPTKGE